MHNSKMPDEFAIFIISHNRAKNIVTLRALDNSNYQGKIYIVIDDTDPAIEDYREEFGDNLVIFNKMEVAKTFDTGDNFSETRSAVYARNALHDIAKEKGLDYFLVLDDDYTSFRTRFDETFTYTTKSKVIDINRVIKSCIEFFKIDKRILTFCFAQGGDYIGGPGSGICFGKGLVGLKRKAMNSFLCATDRPFKFHGTLNEDATTYMYLGSLGHLFFTTNQYALEQMETQTNSGGNTDIYLQQGTYVKSFYSVMFQPSSIDITMMGVRFKRLHHRVNWNCTVPKILSQSFKKV